MINLVEMINRAEDVVVETLVEGVVVDLAEGNSSRPDRQLVEVINLVETDLVETDLLRPDPKPAPRLASAGWLVHFPYRACTWEDRD